MSKSINCFFIFGVITVFTSLVRCVTVFRAGCCFSFYINESVTSCCNFFCLCFATKCTCVGLYTCCCTCWSCCFFTFVPIVVAYFAYCITYVTCCITIVCVLVAKCFAFCFATCRTCLWCVAICIYPRVTCGDCFFSIYCIAVSTLFVRCVTIFCTCCSLFYYIYCKGVCYYRNFFCITTTTFTCEGF